MSRKIRVVVGGSEGRMGRIIRDLIVKTSDVEVVSGFDPKKQDLKNFSDLVKLEKDLNKKIDVYIKENNIKCEGVYPDFLWHATNVHPDKFKIDPDLYWDEVENGNVWDIEMPSGVLFLSTDINEASVYGNYVIPFELNTKDIFVKEIPGDGPSVAFDDDYNYGSKLNIWQGFEDSMDKALEVRGRKNGKIKSTFVAYFDVLNPRLDIAKEFYK